MANTDTTATRRLTIHEVAEIEGCSYRAVWGWIRGGYGPRKIKLKAYKTGKCWRVIESDLEAFRVACTESAETTLSEDQQQPVRKRKLGVVEKNQKRRVEECRRRLSRMGI